MKKLAIAAIAVASAVAGAVAMVAMHIVHAIARDAPFWCNFYPNIKYCY